MILLFLSTFYTASTCLDFNGYAIWWNVKPYIFADENGTQTGVIVDLLDRYNKYCRRNRIMFTYPPNNTYANYPAFYKMIESNFTSTIDLRNKHVTQWFPILSPDVKLIEKDFVFRNIFMAPGATVIVRTDEIDLFKKLVVGAHRTANLVLMSVAIMFCLGVSIWLWVSFMILKRALQYCKYLDKLCRHTLTYFGIKLDSQYSYDL